MNHSQANPKQDFFELTDDIAAIGTLRTMTVSQLVAKYQELFGEPTRSRNRQYLARALAWRIQEQQLGGLSCAALAKIAQLARKAPRPWRSRTFDVSLPTPAATAVAPPTERAKPPKRTKVAKSAQSTRPTTPAPPSKPRDPRLPDPGTTLRRVYRGQLFEVVVHQSDIEFAGQRFASLSEVARLITGTRWNGFVFFGIKPSPDAEVFS